MKKNSKLHASPPLHISAGSSRNQLEEAILNAIDLLQKTPVQFDGRDEGIRVLALSALCAIYERYLRQKHPGLKEAMYWMRNGLDKVTEVVETKPNN